MTCAYRGVDGAKCAVGVLITDEEYSPLLEGVDVFNMYDRDLLPPRLKEHIDLLCELQHWHDLKWNGTNTWSDSLARIAKSFGLSVPIQDGCTS